MSPSECGNCARPVGDGATLCRGCTTRLRRELRSIPELVEDLHIMLARQDRLTPRQAGRGSETPVPWKNPASVALADLHAYLTSWVQCIAEESGLSIGRLRDASPACAAWLLHHLPVVRHHPAAGELLSEITRSTERARAVTDLPPNSSRFLVGPCPEIDDTGAHCDGEVWANIPTTTDVPALLRCRICTTSWDTTRWYRAGERILARRRQLERTPRG